MMTANNRLWNACLLLCLLGTGATVGWASEPDQRPNVLVVLVDDMGYSDPGFMGGEVPTPHIDRLAQGGLRFTQCYNSARCCPSRAALATGLYPHQAGIGSFATREPDRRRGPAYLGRLNDQCVTFAEVLGQAGYQTYMVGKWHMERPGPVARGFDEFYGFVNGYEQDQWEPERYVRLPAGREPELSYGEGEFYATDVFTDYTLEFLKQARSKERKDQPWLVYLAHSSPHFPVQAPRESVEKFLDTYRQGWDVLRQQRFENMQQNGLAESGWKLTERSMVPVDREDIANGFSGQQNPAWDSLPAERREDLAHRGAIAAAMLHHVDQGLGRIIENLEQHGEMENTLILFMSDNGACYEWGPFGFDGPSRQGKTKLHVGEELASMGGPGSYHAYGSGWANLGNTPFKLYKHFCHEGGNCTPLIAHWPAGIARPDRWIREPVNLIDVMPTLCDVAQTEYPETISGREIIPAAGLSLKPIFAGGDRLPPRSLFAEHQQARSVRKGKWKAVWSKRMPGQTKWELYDLQADRCETIDLADEYPEVVAELDKEWKNWAAHVKVFPFFEEAQPAPNRPRKPGQTSRRQQDQPQADIVDQWRYRLRQPAEGWSNVDFDDSQWRQGNGGFGTQGTPGARIGTPWRSRNIWLRKTFDMQNVPQQVALLIYHDEDAEVFLNGERIAKLEGYVTEYQRKPLSAEQVKLLKPEGNVLAIHCRQTTGGQFIDAHLVDAQAVPELPQPERDPTPFASKLMTQWGAEVTADNAWTEYPRPQMQRSNWQNLNGHWDYAITSASQTAVPENWNGKILVPFCPESKLSGVSRLIAPEEALWYRRTFTTDTSQATRLNFEAVDYRCEVFVNGKSVGKHRGGNTPFSFNISNAVVEGANELIVRVEDQQEGYQLRGKQVLNPRGIWYTQVTGIWQTAWLESVNRAHITRLKIDTDADAGSLDVAVFAATDRVMSYRVRIFDGEREVARGEGQNIKPVRCVVPNAKLWSPTSPHLYHLKVELLDQQGNAVDQVDSYAGIRTVGKVQDDQGHWRFTLNGHPIFHWGPLDQGWWPDGLLTPPSDEAMLFDIEWLKAAGFNMIRKHIKVEPRRYYYHCDRLGMLVWQDQVSGGPGPRWTRLQPDPEQKTWPQEHHDQFMLEMKWMIDSLYNHPSIVVWVPFNESWGQHQTIDVGKWAVDYDPSRLVNIASGGNFQPVGDIVDQHHYPDAAFPFDLNKAGRFDDYIKVVGEFGGHGFPLEDHLWDPETRNWGYGGLPKTKQEYRDRYRRTFDQLFQLKSRGIAGGVYTQTTDVEGEINGLMTYDRKVFKIPAAELKEMHHRIYDAQTR